MAEDISMVRDDQPDSLRVLMTEVIPGGPAALVPQVFDLAASREMFVLFGLRAHGEIEQACFESESDAALAALRSLFRNDAGEAARGRDAARASALFRSGYERVQPADDVTLFLNPAPRPELFAPGVQLANYLGEFRNCPPEVLRESILRLSIPKPPPPVFLLDAFKSNDLACLQVTASDGEQWYRGRIEQLYSVGRGLGAELLGQEIRFVGNGGVWGMDPMLEPGERGLVFLGRISGTLYERFHLRVEQIDAAEHVVIQVGRQNLPQSLRSTARDLNRKGWTDYCAVPRAAMEAYVKDLVATRLIDRAP